MKRILVINGSASAGSSNQRLIERVSEQLNDFDIVVYDQLKSLPHFDPALSDSDPPASIVEIREQIKKADGVIFCTPEYVFSIPSGLKNLIEWCVSTVVFSEKPTGIITAAAMGEKGHEELQLIMRTVTAKFTHETTLLIPGIKGKINGQGEIVHEATRHQLSKFTDAFRKLVNL